MDTAKVTQKVTPKDFFLEFSTMLCLYVSVWSLLTLFFSSIDRVFPDALNPFYSTDSYTPEIRFAIAALIIIFPIFIVLAYALRRGYETHPEKQNLWIRRWVTYFNIFVSGATIAISLIVVLNSFLGGELTVRFVLKSLAAIAVAVIVFSYFIFDIRKGLQFSRRTRTLYFGAGGVLVIAAIIFGFYVMGSPFNQRLRRFDNQRVSDLQSIQQQMIFYWQQKGRLPEKISDLQDPISGFFVPVDPEQKEYEYSRSGSNEYVLCASFALESAEKNFIPNSPVSMRPTRSYGTIENWSHKAGRQCFDRKIDPELYPVKLPLK